MSDDATPAANGHGDMDQADDTSIDMLQAEIAALKEQVLRVAADAENVKRRAERDANDSRAYAIQSFGRDLLGVADNLQRALEHAPRDSQDAQVKNLVVGLEMTEKALLQAFERNGLKRVDPVRGAKFDPHLHQAMMEQPATDVGPGAVLQVLQPGYELYGRIVRPAMVVVSAKGSAGAAPGEAAGANPYAHADDGAGGTFDTKA